MAEATESAAAATDVERGLDTCLRVVLFDADGKDRGVPLDEVDCARLGEQQLLWIDVQGDDPELIAEIGKRLRFPAALVEQLQSLDGAPRLENYSDYFHVQALAVATEKELKYKGHALGLVAGQNFVLSVHRKPILFLERLRERERGETELGALSAESFIAALLDWHLSTYFEAVADFEASVDRLEISVLSKRQRNSLDELQQLRRGAARLRRMLSAHRAVFAGLARPDFRPRADGQASAHFLALDNRFERAMDMVENARELVVGSFELFTTRMAQRTNDSMRALTFVASLLGIMAVAAGVLGMNFDAPFFETGARGFWIALASMAVFAVVALIVARLQRWV